MENFFALYSEIVLKLFISLLLGSLVGTQRNWSGKQAGMRTYALVAMGSCLFVTISEVARLTMGMGAGFDPLRMASQVIVGIGFLGAGLIIFKNDNFYGLTTAAGLWVASGVGMAVGFGFYTLAAIATLFTLFIFSTLWRVEKVISPQTADVPILPIIPVAPAAPKRHTKVGLKKTDDLSQ